MRSASPMHEGLPRGSAHLTSRRSHHDYGLLMRQACDGVGIHGSHARLPKERVRLTRDALSHILQQNQKASSVGIHPRCYASTHGLRMLVPAGVPTNLSVAGLGGIQH